MLVTRLAKNSIDRTAIKIQTEKNSSTKVLLWLMSSPLNLAKLIMVGGHVPRWSCLENVTGLYLQAAGRSALIFAEEGR